MVPRVHRRPGLALALPHLEQAETLAHEHRSPTGVTVLRFLLSRVQVLALAV